jgi:Tol biopolymer transport system component
LIAVALLLAALAGTIAVGAWFNQPAPVREIVTYENGMIVASQGCGQIVGIDPTSLEAREIGRLGSDCEEGPWAHSPVWSSDGTRLAYIVSASAQDPDVAGIWVYEAATGEARRLDLCRDESCSDIDISPTGSLISYLSWVSDGTLELVVAEVDSGEIHRIDLASQPRTPRFSPDGSHIALPMIGGQSGIHIIDIRGLEDGNIGSPTLLSGIVDADAVAWSPDGEWIAYRQSGGLGIPDQEPFNGQIGHSGVGIVVARVDGSETRVLATGGAVGGPGFPTWSADSASVAYVRTPTQTIAKDRWMLELWTVAIDGGEPTRIYESGWGNEGFGVPDWSPDGEWIAFGLHMPDDPAATGTFLVRPDGSDVRRASDVMLDPVWQPIPKD